MCDLRSFPWVWVFALVLVWTLAGCESSGSSSDAPAPPTSTISVVPAFITLEPLDLENLYQRDPFSEDRLHAVARVGHVEVAEEPIEIRFRGSSSRLLPKKSFNIRFAERQDFLFGSARMNANATTAR